MENWTVYMYTFPNQKRYIGCTKRSLYARQGKNFRGYKSCPLLWPAIQEFGCENIETTILFQGQASREEAASMEKHFIEAYQTNIDGYNTYGGGEGLAPRTYSDEWLETLRAQAREFGKARKGCRATDETRRRLSVSHTGKIRGPMSDETKAKISKGNSRENMSPETQRRRSEVKMKMVKMVKPDGSIEIFRNRQEVAAIFGVNSPSVSRWINGKRRSPSGYKFFDYSPTTTE